MMMMMMMMMMMDDDAAHPKNWFFVSPYSSNWNLDMLVFEEKRKPEYPEITSRSNGQSQQQTQPTYGFHGFEPRSHWWKASALTTAPLSLPQYTGRVHWVMVYRQLA